jgi:hypothetical protein
MTSSARRTLVLGGGFAGAHAARRLGRTLASRRDLEVVLISDGLEPAAARKTLGDAEQLVTLRDVGGMEKLGVILRAMRGAATSNGGAPGANEG